MDGVVGGDGRGRGRKWAGKEVKVVGGVAPAGGGGRNGDGGNVAEVGMESGVGADGGRGAVLDGEDEEKAAGGESEAEGQVGGIGAVEAEKQVSIVWKRVLGGRGRWCGERRPGESPGVAVERVWGAGGGASADGIEDGKSAGEVVGRRGGMGEEELTAVEDEAGKPAALSGMDEGAGAGGGEGNAE